MVTSIGVLGEGVGLGLRVKSGIYDALKSCYNEILRVKAGVLYICVVGVCIGIRLIASPFTSPLGWKVLKGSLLC